MDIKHSNEINHELPLGKSLEEYPYALSSKVFHTKQLFLYSEKVLPGKKSSAPHYHRSIDEIIYITQGELIVFEGEERALLRKGDSTCFYANSEKLHYLENQSNDEAIFLIFRRSTVSDDVIYSIPLNTKNFPSKV